MNILIGSFVLAVAGLSPFLCSAHGSEDTPGIRASNDKTAVQRVLLAETQLPDMKGYNFTSLTVELKPGVVIPSHQHEALVFVYVLAGQVVSHLNNQPTVVYVAGDHWVEQPGDIHSKTHNPNKGKAAKLLVVFVAKEGARLTTSGDIPK